MVIDNYRDEKGKFIGKTPFSLQPNEKHYGWKGDKVSYSALHNWVRKNKPKTKACEQCNAIKKLELANMGIYDRNFDNWKWLCKKCHINYDDTRRGYHAKQKLTDEQRKEHKQKDGKKWRKNNPNYMKEYRKKTIEKRREYDKKYYEQHKEIIKARQRAKYIPKKVVT